MTTSRSPIGPRFPNVGILLRARCPGADWVGSALTNIYPNDIYTGIGHVDVRGHNKTDNNGKKKKKKKKKINSTNNNGQYKMINDNIYAGWPAYKNPTNETSSTHFYEYETTNKRTTTKKKMFIMPSLRMRTFFIGCSCFMCGWVLAGLAVLFFFLLFFVPFNITFCT